jgi:hypothetical protein
MCICGSSLLVVFEFLAFAFILETGVNAVMAEFPL